MRKIKYNLPVYDDNDLADLNQYSEEMAQAIKNQIDKFGSPLNFKGVVLTLNDLQLILDNQNGDIYAVKENNKNYIWNGEAWGEYSDYSPATTDEIVKEVVDLIQGKARIYGIKRNIETSDSAWERIGDSIGLVANATKDGTEVANDFDTIYPWSDIISYNYDTEAQRITAFYGEPTFKFDGTNGEVLTRFPEFWYKREQKVESDGNTYEYVYIADGKVDGFIKSEQFSLGRYPTFVDTEKEKVYSKSGVKGSTININHLRNYTKALGDDFCLLDWHYFLIQLLFLVEYANYNSQEILGQGNSHRNGIVTNGECDILEMKSGCLIDDGNHSVIYRGVENIFGNLAQIIEGVMGGRICYNSQKYGVDYTDESYNKLNYEFAKPKLYIKEIGYDENNPIVQMPKTVDRVASSTTYITDFWNPFADAIEEDSSMITVGGSCYVDNISFNGLWSYNLFCSTYQGVGSRLILNK